MFVVLARIGRLGAFVADDAELLGGQHGAPFRVALLDGEVCHVVVCLCCCVEAAAVEEGAEEGGDAGHGPEGAGLG